MGNFGALHGRRLGCRGGEYEHRIFGGSSASGQASQSRESQGFGCRGGANYGHRSRSLRGNHISTQVILSMFLPVLLNISSILLLLKTKYLPVLLLLLFATKAQCQTSPVDTANMLIGE